MLKLVSFAANSPPANAIYPSCNLVLKMNFALVLVISYTLSCQGIAHFLLPIYNYSLLNEFQLLRLSQCSMAQMLLNSIPSYL